MGKNASSPPPPDYAGAAKEQGAANVETARVQGRMNNPNTYGPLGNQIVTWEGGDQPTIRQTLTPDAQAAFDSQQRVQSGLSELGEQGLGTVRNAIGQPFSPNLPRLQEGLQNVGDAPVNQGMTGQAAIMERLAPLQEQEAAATRQRLANQGLVPGGEAYDNEMRIQGQRQNDAKTQAALQGLSLDAGAQNQRFNQEQARAQFGNTALQQSLAQQTQLRNQPLNEISGLMSGGQIQMPQFAGYQGSQIAPPPIFAGAQAAEQSAMQRYGINQAGANASNSGMMGLAGTVIGAAGVAF